ncbi:MAG: GDSL-type esterase/lipase family protein [Verrucomicrobia bacterium]|nr:GDSL-type esterase/lipase family protein [Verrucomicrobiota bacterium]
MRFLSIAKIVVRIGLCWSFGLLGLPVAQGADGSLPGFGNARNVVFLGDSITYSGQYAVYLEAFYRTRFPATSVKFLDLGLPSETVSGLSEPGHAGGRFPRPDLHERLARVLDRSHPDLVLACYGMNDGIYYPISDERFERFRNGIMRLHEAVLASGAKIIHLTPPTFDPVPLKGRTLPAGLDLYPQPFEGYNGVLDRFSEWLLDQRAKGWAVVDIHGPMNRHLAVRRSERPEFLFAGDGVHANETGHWLMTQALLEAWGVPADADAAVLDAGTGRAVSGMVSNIERDKGEIRFQWVSRIPAPMDPKWDARSIELEGMADRFNRYRLKVSGLLSDRYDFYEGETLLATVPRQDLEAGLDLLQFPELSSNRRALKLMEKIRQRQRVLTDSGLTSIGHERPGMNRGLPVEEAAAKAADLESEIRGLMTPLTLALRLQASVAPFPGRRSDWNGYDRYDFVVDGKPVLVVVPKEPAPGRPWVWHGEFFGHKPAPDIALLGEGFHIVYMSVPDMLGAPEAVRHWNVFYRELTERYGFFRKAALVGLSRGGLYVYNWAAENPEHVACIYGDAPVCDFKSWPGGRGTGKGSPRDWKLVLARYGFASDAEALAYQKNPIDRLEPLAKAGVPLLHVFGDADEVVPYEENTAVMAERYQKLGGAVMLIRKPGIGHHPHGLDDSTPIIEFIRANSLKAVTPQAEDSDPLHRAWRALPKRQPEDETAVGVDWLVHSIARKAAVFRGETEGEIILDNGLVQRTFRARPNGATVGFLNRMTGASVIRAVKPEALATVDGKEWEIGGLTGQPNHAYLLPEWIDQLETKPEVFRCVGFDVKDVESRIVWKRSRHGEDRPWPPPGVGLAMLYESTAPELKGLRVSVHYELYDGTPILAKWLVIHNGRDRAVRLDSFTNELLAVVEVESMVDRVDPAIWKKPWLQLLSDYSFGGMDPVGSNRTTRWLPDPEYSSQVNYERLTPALVVSRPPIGPAAHIEPGSDFTSFRTFVVVHDSDNRERQGLALRRLFRTVAPWVTENPLMMHVLRSDRQTFRDAVDQCADVGFEMIIYTFGSRLNMENDRPDYLARIKEDVDYAHSKGIQVGGYSLLASRRIDDENDVINPKTGKTGGAIFGNSPCLGSVWAGRYFRNLTNFIAQTGFDLLEHDGNYPGDVCASVTHPGHRGLEDSQWTQWQRMTELYRWCRERGVYLNVPDSYYLAGSSKSGMGYRETNWSLPRHQQIILGRQNIFDGTWEKTPSMGWMFVPLTEYHGGGAAATIEPLSEHLDTYKAHLLNNLGAGVQACYRGPRLYDSEATRVLVKQQVAWFKRYRNILESDVIHVRRADGRDVDCLLHVNPALKRCGLAMVYNPLPVEVTRDIRLPLYYTGLTEIARVRIEEGAARDYRLERDFSIKVSVKVPANDATWILIEAP